MSSHGLTYISVVCHPKLYCFNICNNFHIHELKKKIAFSLKYVLLHKKYSSPTITPPKQMQS